VQRLVYFILLLFFIRCFSFAQTGKLTVSGLAKGSKTKSALPYVNVTLKAVKDSSFVTGTITNQEGSFAITDAVACNYYIEFSFVGYSVNTLPVFMTMEM
jgi:hypothetical protein